MNTFVTLALAESEKTLTTSEKLSQMLNTALTGYLLVFAVMALIWAILEIFGMVFGEKKNGKKITEEESNTGNIAISQETFSDASENDEAETVAAIIAAISAYTDKPQTSFRVVSFKKVGNNR